MPVVPNTPRRVPALDGVRGLAILLVLLWHVIIGVRFPHHPYLDRMIEFGHFTWSGVDLFFVLSGFLIGGILMDAARSSSYFSTFYIRRMYRRAPARRVEVPVHGNRVNLREIPFAIKRNPVDAIND